MPSQLSGTTTESSRSYSVQVNGTFVQGRSESSGNDMQAASRTVGILAHSYNRKSETMVSSLHEVCKPSSTAPKQLCNGSTAPLIAGKVVGHNGHSGSHIWNGGTHSVLPVKQNVSSPKSQAAHSNEQSSVTSHCNSGRLICPQHALQHASGLVSKKAAKLASKQKLLQERVITLEQQIREKQLSLISRHIGSQMSLVENRGHNLDRTGDSSIGGDAERSASTPGGQLPFPIQVDGASDDAFLSQVSLPESDMFGGESSEVEASSANCMPSRSRCDDSFSSLESYATTSSGSSSYLTSEGDSLSGRRAVKCAKAHATSVAGLLDPDLTDTSSDEEDVNELGIQHARQTR